MKTLRLLLDKRHFPTLPEARAWVADRGYDPALLEESSIAWRFRCSADGKYVRTISIGEGATLDICEDAEPAGMFSGRRFEAIRATDVQDDRVRVSFSSETRVKDFPFEPPVMLLHEPGSVDFSRLEDFGAVLLNHDVNRVVGVPEQIQLDERRHRAKAVLRFGSDEESQTALQKVRDGLIRGISVFWEGEKRHAVRLEEGAQWKSPRGRTFRGPMVIVSRWRPKEISLTPVPADTSVGVDK